MQNLVHVFGRLLLAVEARTPRPPAVSGNGGTNTLVDPPTPPRPMTMREISDLNGDDVRLALWTAYASQ